MVLGHVVDRERAASPPPPVVVQRAPTRLPLSARYESEDEPHRNPAHELHHPMSLEDFAKASSERRGGPPAQPRRKRVHTAEITRLLRSLHDEGARLADEEPSQSNVLEVASKDVYEREDSFPEATPPKGKPRVRDPIEPPPVLRLATPAVIMGLPARAAQARPRARRVVSTFEEPTKVAAAGEVESLRESSRQVGDDTLPTIIVDPTAR
jgi:hypothetical protein